MRAEDEACRPKAVAFFKCRRCKRVEERPMLVLQDTYVVGTYYRMPQAPERWCSVSLDGPLSVTGLVCGECASKIEAVAVMRPA